MQSLGLQKRNNLGSTGTIGPGTMDEHYVFCTLHRFLLRESTTLLNDTSKTETISDGMTNHFGVIHLKQ
jgi:hypothetical protein